MANSKFARASRAGHRAGKPGSAAYKAAFRKAFKGRRGGGARKAPRKVRRAARRAAKAPRRRRVRMARRKRKSGGRRRSLKITPLFVAKVAVGIAGLKMIADADPVGFANFVVKNPKSLADPKLYGDAAKRFGPGVLVAAAGPKVVGKVVSLATKAVPGSSRLTNATIVRV